MIPIDRINRDFKILRLDNRANTYLQEVIEYATLLNRSDVDYPQFLPAQILQKFDLASGKIITCLPNDTLEKDIYDFSRAKINTEESNRLLSQGHIVEVEDTSEWLVTVFKKHLDFCSDNAIVLKNIGSLPSDPFFNTIQEKTLTTDNEVFFFLTNDDGSVDKIRSIVKLSRGAEFALCTRLPGFLRKGGELSEEHIIQIDREWGQGQ